MKELKGIIEKINHPYLYYHAKRYETLVELVSKYYSRDNRILDIGNSFFADIVSILFKCQVDELGFLKDSTKTFGNQIQFDLNDCHDKSLWRTDTGLYDIIVFAEVIEHLYTSPDEVLDYLYSLLNENGVLILQTPNAVVFHKRIQMLFGMNPYMLIGKDRKNPGHFREYTKSELKAYARNCSFTVDHFYYENYFDYQYTLLQNAKGKKNKYLKLISLFYSICPPFLKPGITMVLSKS